MRLALCAAVVALAAGSAAAAVPPAQVRIAGARPAEQRVLASLLRELGPSPVTAIRLYRTPRPGKPALAPGTARMIVDAGSTMEGHWDADVLIRRYVALAAAGGGLRQVAGFHPKRSASPHTARLDLSPARSAAVAAGAKVVQARIVLGAGVAFVVQASNPAQFLKEHGRSVVAALRRPQPQAASFFAVEDSSGTVVYEVGGISYAGFFHAEPDLLACGPIDFSPPPFQVIPPCGG